MPGATGVVDIYRVRVRGSYPPRALRYELLVDGRPVGYAIPTPDADAAEAVTTDAAVLTGRLGVRYGRGAPTPPAIGPVAPAARAVVPARRASPTRRLGERWP